MRILRPITTALACAILALANACGGTQTGNLDGSPQGDQQRIGSGFELRNAEAAPDSIDAAALRIETREENGHTVVDILSRRQLPSGSLLLELLYDI